MDNAWTGHDRSQCTIEQGPVMTGHNNARSSKDTLSSGPLANNILVFLIRVGSLASSFASTWRAMSVADPRASPVAVVKRCGNIFPIIIGSSAPCAASRKKAVMAAIWSFLLDRLDVEWSILRLSSLLHGSEGALRILAKGNWKIERSAAAQIFLFVGW